MNINIDYYTNYEDEEHIEKYQKFIEKYIPKVKEMLENALKMKNILKKRNIYLGLGVVTRGEIKKLNAEFRNVDRETDVLSFPIFTKEEVDKLDEDNLLEEISIGDIVLCLDVVEKQALEYGTGLEREMLYMICHGICHLLGSDHEIEEEKQQMRNMEEDILSSIS